MKTQLTDVRGVGPSTARNLEALDIRTVVALAEASARDVAAIRGFGEARAAEVIAAARVMLDAAGAPIVTTSETTPQATNAVAPLQDEIDAVNGVAHPQGDGLAVAKRLEVKREKKKIKRRSERKKRKIRRKKRTE